MLYVGLGLVSVGMVITFVGLGDKVTDIYVKQQQIMLNPFYRGSSRCSCEWLVLAWLVLDFCSPFLEFSCASSPHISTDAGILTPSDIFVR